MRKLLGLFKKAGKRAIVVGDEGGGVVVGLDLEGRWFAVLDGQVVSRVNPEAILGQNTPGGEYLNPGGDGLWPAPEGTTLGYQHITGRWRVPPGLRSARFLVEKEGAASATICAEVDMINNQGLGVPTLFSRSFKVSIERGALTVKVLESLRYIGTRSHPLSALRLAPWSLGQFDCGEGCETIFKCPKPSSVWDLYEDTSAAHRQVSKGVCTLRTDGTARFQVGIAPEVPWIEFRNPRHGLVVRRSAAALPKGQLYRDIRDGAPDLEPSRRGVRYSVYCDPSGFMEVEAAGGCSALTRPNDTMQVMVTTRITRS